MKLGCSTVLFNQLDLYGALQHISWAGYQGADVSDIILARHIRMDSGKSNIYEVEYAARKHGLELFSIDTEDQGRTEEDKIKSMAKVFNIAQKLSIPVVAPYLHGKSGREGEKRNIEYIRKLSEQAASRGVMMAIKVHVGTPIDKAATLIQILDEIDSPGLGAAIDTRELCRAGDDIFETISKINKRIVHVHLRDYPGREQMPADISPTYSATFGQWEPWRPSVEQQIPGRGGLDFPNIFKCLKNVGYDKAVDLVITGAFTYPLSRQMAIAGEARGYLNRCLQELK